MNAVLVALMLLWQFPVDLKDIPKNNPNGIWEASTGSRFELRLTGSNLNVKIVPGSNARFKEYELDLKNQEEPNTYKGTGHFVAKLANSKECRFDTEWHIVVITDEKIIGAATNIDPDPETCKVKDSYQIQLDLTRKK